MSKAIVIYLLLPACLPALPLRGISRISTTQLPCCRGDIRLFSACLPALHIACLSNTCHLPVLPVCGDFSEYRLLNRLVMEEIFGCSHLLGHYLLPTCTAYLRGDVATLSRLPVNCLPICEETLRPSLAYPTIFAEPRGESSAKGKKEAEIYSY